jgi:hypothetical protein
LRRASAFLVEASFDVSEVFFEQAETNVREQAAANPVDALISVIKQTQGWSQHLLAKAEGR